MQLKTIDAETLNARLLDGHRLLVRRDKDRVVACEVEFFEEAVPVALFNTYVADGMIDVPKDGRGYALSKEGRKRLKKRPPSSGRREPSDR